MVWGSGARVGPWVQGQMLVQPRGCKATLGSISRPPVCVEAVGAAEAYEAVGEP
jgi:hypothetical protein